MNFITIHGHKLGNLVGRGATSEVYQLNDTQVIKLYNTGCSEDSLKYEYEKMLSAYKNHVPVPRIYELVEYNGRLGYIMEYIVGKTLKNVLDIDIAKVTVGEISMDEFTNNFFSYIKQTANTLFEVHKIKSEQMEKMDDRLKWHTQNTEILSEEEKLKIINLINALPNGDSVCHGDPNPNNIMVSNNKFQLIDWVNAGVGNPFYDIAEYVWLSTPSLKEIPEGTPKPLLEFYYQNKNAIIPTFLDEYERVSRMNVADYEKWMIPLLVSKLHSNRSMEQKKIILEEIRDRLNNNYVM